MFSRVCFIFYCCVNRPEDLHRIRVEHMERQLANLTIERQLANLTGLVQKALHQTGPPTSNINQNYLGVPGQYRGKFMHFQLKFCPNFLLFIFHSIPYSIKLRFYKSLMPKELK